VLLRSGTGARDPIPPGIINTSSGAVSKVWVGKMYSETVEFNGFTQKEALPLKTGSRVSAMMVTFRLGVIKASSPRASRGPNTSKGAKAGYKMYPYFVAWILSGFTCMTAVRLTWNSKDKASQEQDDEFWRKHFWPSVFEDEIETLNLQVQLNSFSNIYFMPRPT
jgi:hypothetical protein